MSTDDKQCRRGGVGGKGEKDRENVLRKKNRKRFPENPDLKRND